MIRPTLIVALVGAFPGAMVGAMFDRPTDPGGITAVGALVGAVCACLLLLRLRRCDPFRRHYE